MTLNDSYSKLIEGLRMPFGYLTDSDSRLHVLYLFTSLLLAYYVFRKSKTEGSFWNYVFAREMWLGRSAMVDYGLIFFNSLFKVFLIAPYLVFGLYLSYKVELWLPQLLGYPSFALSATTTVVLYTLVFIVADDFGTYITHYIFHHVPFMWEFHKVHHSATVLNPVTQYRIHPIELIVNNIKGIIVLGLVTGLFRYLSAYPLTEMTVIGVNIFSFAFFFFGANLRHSHVPLKYFNWLEYIFISPYQHQIHHSNDPAHFNRNIGAKLAIWDWMFGTLIRSEAVESVRFGIGDEDPHFNSVWKNLWMPFSNLGRRIRSIRQD